MTEVYANRNQGVTMFFQILKGKGEEITSDDQEKIRLLTEKLHKIKQGFNKPPGHQSALLINIPLHEQLGFYAQAKWVLDHMEPKKEKKNGFFGFGKKK